MRWLFSICIYLMSCLATQGQSLPSFKFSSDSIKSYSFDFTEINNLILVPLFVNESDTLFFILDSGAENIVLFGSEFDSLPIDTNLLRSVKVGGLGEGDAIEAFVSPFNTVRVGEITGLNQNLIYIDNDLLNFSDLLGHPVHGILGISIFHSFVVKVNYFNHKLTFIRHENFKARKRFSDLDLTIHNNRPYIELDIQIQPQINLVTNLLLDLGESKPISLYLNSHELIFLPQPNYYTNLGKGITGMVNGRVASISSISLDRFILKNVVTAFPSQDGLVHVGKIEDRNGSLGAGILKKFICTFDLKNKKLYIKRTGLLRHPFIYDKTGVIIVTEGENYDQFRITGIIEGTAGARAGLKIGDKILKIGEESVEGKKLGDVLKLIETSGRRFYITVLRDEQSFTCKLHIPKF